MQIVLPRRVRPQPQPHLHPEGDCGPCVLAGLLDWEVRDVYERLYDGKPRSLSREDMRRALWGSRGFDRIIEEAPLGWTVYEAHRAFGSPAHLQGLGWFGYIRMAVEAGYYGLAQVSYRKLGPTGPGTDHWVLLCGARERHPPAGQGGTIAQEVLVSCSAKSSPDEEWVDAHEFLRSRGGFNLLLARPDSPVRS